jgi:hypothetical protein
MAWNSPSLAIVIGMFSAIEEQLSIFVPKRLSTRQSLRAYFLFMSVARLVNVLGWI